MAYENTTQAKTKKMERPLTESESENEMDENFYQFIVLESIEETPITKLSPFLIQKTIETHYKPINIKKAMNNTIIIQTTNQRQSEKILKWKQFGKLNCGHESETNGSSRQKRVRLCLACRVVIWSEGRNTAITVSRSVCERKEKYSPLFQ